MDPEARTWSVMIDATAYYRLSTHVPAAEAVDRDAARARAVAEARQPALDLGTQGRWSVYAFEAGLDYGGGSVEPAADGGFDVVLVARLVAARSLRVTAADEDGAVAAAYASPEAAGPPWPAAHGDWALEADGGFEIGEPEEVDAPAGPGPG